jgi:hypothetical protein
VKDTRTNSKRDVEAVLGGDIDDFITNFLLTKLVAWRVGMKRLLLASLTATLFCQFSLPNNPTAFG